MDNTEQENSNDNINNNNKDNNTINNNNTTTTTATTTIEENEKIMSMSDSTSQLSFESRACSTSSLTSMISSISSQSIMSSSSSSIIISPSSSPSPTKRKLIQGELVKQGHIFKSWRTRWFKIEDGYLCYYKSKEEPEPIDKVPLRGARVSKKPFHDRPNTFELIATTMRKIFLLQGKDTEDVDFWMTEISKEIEYARSLYSKTQQTRV